MSTLVGSSEGAPCDALWQCSSQGYLVPGVIWRAEVITPRSTQGFFLALSSGITPGNAQLTKWDVRDQISSRLATCKASALPAVLSLAQCVGSPSYFFGFCVSPDGTHGILLALQSEMAFGRHGEPQGMPGFKPSSVLN